MTEEKILKQFEFYFSDSNLPNDKFLRSQVANNLEGYVSLDIICNFKRILDITKDREIILAALANSNMLQVDKDGKNIRRITPLPETNSMTQRTVYVKGLPSDSTIESVEALFKGFNVACVRLRRNKESKEFKGSAFVEFSTEEQVADAIKKEFLVNENKLTLMPKKDYDAIKSSERNEKKLKEKKEKYQKEIEETKRKYGISPGVVVKVTGLAKTEGQKGDTLKEKFNTYGEVAYVDYPMPSKDGRDEDWTVCYARFKDAEGAKKLSQEFADSEIKLGGESRCVATILDEKLEDEYIIQMIVRNNEKKGKKRKNKFKSGRGKRSKRDEK